VNADEPPLVELSEPTAVDTGSGSRVRADVDGVEIFFESDDIELMPAPEVFASALLPSVVQRGGRLRTTAPLDPVWLDGVAGILAIWAEWWGTAGSLDEVLDAPRATASASGRARGLALCFSGGVDSFFSLLCSGRDVDGLVMAHGYDVRLGKRRRLEHAETALRAVAADLGIPAIVIRTNLRDERPMKGSGWGRTHGGALAALGHAVSGAYGELMLASSYPPEIVGGWGSTWDTDPGWSSSRLEVIHHGERFDRNAKVEAIIPNPLVRRHIRVCYRRDTDEWNCGECEKCVRTMVAVAVRGERLEDWPFAGSGSLVERIDRVESVHPHQVPNWRGSAELSDDPELRAAIARLMAREYDRFEDRARRAREREARADQAKARGPDPKTRAP
jgi:hypothetical protein